MSRPFSSGDLLADRRFAYAQDCLADGDVQAALEMTEQALELAPRFAPAWFLLGRAREARFAVSGEPADEQAARSAYACALEIDPDDTLGARVFLAGLGGSEELVAMTPAYVRALFDGYAPRFERHLVGTLGYRAPELIVQALDALPDAPARFGSALDLGCGTGLMGRALAGRVAHLTGVDLSPAMLALAERTGLYARLVEGELIAFLAREPPERVDLVVSADVLIYLPDAGSLFAGVSRVLRPGGYALHSAQSHDGADVVLGPDGRYAHGESHLRWAADTAGLTLLGLLPATVRKQHGRGVPGWIAALQKPD